ncbi:MAG: serine hydrolase domain-containing protein [Desulfobacterales bacterium]|jgi:CubicO group peptidase (beta-lactamase class C family)
MAASAHTPPARIQKSFREALNGGVFPGAVVLVQDADGRRWIEAYGVADSATGEAARPDTVFDLASLTKPLCTALAVMQLIASGRLSLEDRLGDVLASFSATDKADILIRHLLSHQAGFPAWRPYFEILREKPMAERREVLISLLVNEPLEATPGAVSLYSDLDFLVLQIVVETLSGRHLDHYAAEKIYRPLGLAADLFFTSTRVSPPPRAFAATENCPWRGRVLKGHVHDDNAYSLGGVAGHAGLFGTATAVGDLLSALLTAYRRSSVAGVFDPDLVRLFFKRCPPSDGALGFDTPAARDSSSGRYFSPNTVGHLGFTGTSFWMDLDRGIVVVLLTNRVHPSRANEDIRAFRPVIHDQIMAALGIA